MNTFRVTSLAVLSCLAAHQAAGYLTNSDSPRWNRRPPRVPDHRIRRALEVMKRDYRSCLTAAHLAGAVGLSRSRSRAPLRRRDRKRIQACPAPHSPFRVVHSSRRVKPEHQRNRGPGRIPQRPGLLAGLRKTVRRATFAVASAACRGWRWHVWIRNSTFGQVTHVDTKI